MRARVEHVLGDHHVRGGEGRVGGGPVARRPVEDVVVLLAGHVVADHRGAGVQGPGRVHDHRQRLVLHADQLERVPGGVAVLGDDERHLLALEPDLVGGQHGLDVTGQGGHPGQLALLQHLAGDDGPDPGVGQRGGGVHAHDAGVGQRAAQDRAVQHAGPPDVVHERALAAQEPGVLLAPHRAVGPVAGRIGSCAHQSSARWPAPCCAGPVLAGLVLAGPLDGPHDVLVPGAPAQLAGQGLADLRRGRLRVVVEQPPGGHHHARRAEPALQPVALREALLDRVQVAAAGQVLDGAHPVPVGHGRQHRARLHRRLVQPDHAGPAVGGVAPPVRPGQPEVITQEVDQQQPGLHIPGVADPVHGHRYLHIAGAQPVPRGAPPGAPPPCCCPAAWPARASARRSDRIVSSRARWRL